MKLHDLVGQRFGKLVVQRRAPLTKRVKWECLCDCGRTTSVYAFNLTTGNTTTCGCSGMGKASKIDITGQRFGMLVVLRQAGNGGRGSVWECRCDCGRITVKPSCALRSGDTKTCGCGSHPLKYTDPSMSAFKELLAQYRKNAARCGREFNLTEGQFRFLTMQNCHYCGKKPSQDGFFGRTKRRTGVTGRRPYPANGIDRVDNSKGYVATNVVPCCKLCNWMKGSLSEAAFLGHVKQILAQDRARRVGK